MCMHLNYTCTHLFILAVKMRGVTVRKGREHQRLALTVHARRKRMLLSMRVPRLATVVGVGKV